MKRSPWPVAALLVSIALIGATPQLPSPVTRTLPNGLRVEVFQRAGLPIVQTQLQVRAGVSAETEGFSGLAFLTAQLLRQGTASRPAEDFAMELDTLGATLAINVTRDVAQVATGSRAGDLESVLELVSDAVVNPLFSDEAVQSMRRQIATQLGQLARDPATIADERLAALAFGAHPYGRPLRGDFEGLLGATRDQARDFHRDHWRPDRAVLVIAGDVDPERAFKAVSDWFGRWEGRAKPLTAVAVPALDRGVFLYDLPGSPVTEVRLGLLGPGRGDAGHAGWAVAREALVSGLLPNEAQATLVVGSEASLLVLSASARPESTAVVALRLKRALDALGTMSPTSGAWSAARMRAAGAWSLSLETLGQLAASWLAGDAAGQPIDHLRQYATALAAARPDGVAAAAKAGGLLLLAGPGERMKGRLGALGRIDTARVERRSPTPALGGGLQVSVDQKQKGAQFLAAAIAAHGGAVKLQAVHTTQTESELRLSIAGQELTGELRTLRVDPDRMVQVTRVLELEHRQVLDRQRGWTLSTAGDSATMVDADTTAMFSMRGILESDLVHVLRAATATGVEPFSVGRGIVAGQPADQVEFMTPAGMRTRLSIDAKTRRVVMVEAIPTPQGEWRDRRRWPAFQLLEGVWWPAEELREVDGQPVSRSILRRMQVNAEPDSTLFRRPLVVRGQIRGLE